MRSSYNWSFRHTGFTKGCALPFIAAALFLICVPALVADAGEIVVDGAPYWLRQSVERSLRSVWEELSLNPDLSAEDRIRLLSVVAERLFSGYSPNVVPRGDSVRVDLAPQSDTAWGVEINPPPLLPPADEWFADAASELERVLPRMLALLPLEALSWADLALKEAIEEACAPILPGWNPSLLVRLEGSDESRVLRVSFNPKPPLVLAIVPSINSTTLPVAFRSDLKEKLLRSLAPVVGLPIEWASINKLRIEGLAADALLDTNTVTNARAAVDVSFSPEQLSPVEAEVESSKYSIRAWMAGYAGAEGRYPEIGLHLGRKALPVTGWDVELYGEWVMSVEDFSLESRWGFRWSPVKNVLIGAEIAFPGNTLWYRLSVAEGARAPYLWWRLSEDGDSIVGLGYRLDGRISLELHFDERDSDSYSLRAILDL
ncbi:MAG: hypothetical protein QM446_08785 [Synergistota bacterium]|nr:hypothetical protein [Synergistota bacterium]